jgi:hypothetical protein
LQTLSVWFGTFFVPISSTRGGELPRLRSSLRSIQFSETEGLAPKS